MLALILRLVEIRRSNYTVHIVLHRSVLPELRHSIGVLVDAASLYARAEY